MRRLLRILFTLCSALSLLLCVGLTVTVVESDRLFRLMLPYDDERGVARWVEAMDGGLQYGETDHPLFRNDKGWGSMASAGPSMVHDRFLGFGSQTYAFGGTRPRRHVSVWRMPTWPLFLLTAAAALPAWHATLRLARAGVVRIVSRRRARQPRGFDVVPVERTRPRHFAGE